MNEKKLVIVQTYAELVRIHKLLADVTDKLFSIAAESMDDSELAEISDMIKEVVSHE